MACGDNRALPDGHVQPHHDSNTGDADVDAPPDGPPVVGPVNLTNLTPANTSMHTDFFTPLFFKPDGSAVAVVANFAAVGNTAARDDAWLIPLSGTGKHRLADTAALCGAAACDAEVLAWTADGASLFAEGELAANNQFEVFALDPSMTDQTPVLALDVAAANTSVINLFAVPNGGGTRVWAVGDFRTNGTNEAGAFASDATFPFSVGTPPPLLVPGGANKLAGSAFDARGTKIAWVSDTVIATRQDLHVSNADGTNDVIVVTGTIGTKISAVGLSPDGTKVGFVQDSLLIPNGLDLYFVPTAGGTPTQLSPARPLASSTSSALGVFPQFEWSGDSKFIGFSADLTEDTFDQGYVVDTTATTPLAVEVLTRADIAAQTGTKGIRGKLLFDADNNVYFRARVSTANSGVFSFFKADTTGTKTSFELPARADQSVPDVGAFGISPDGHTMVFSSDSPVLGTYDLYKQAL